MEAKMTVTLRKRSFIQSASVNPYLYHFHDIMDDSLLPSKFLRIPMTNYCEFGGSHEEALEALTDAGITDIIEGDEL